MKTDRNRVGHRRKYAALFSLVVFVLGVAILVWLAQRQQDTREAIKAIKILVKAGADVNHRNHDGEMAIDVARHRGAFDKSVIMLLEQESHRKVHPKGKDNANRNL